MTKDCITLNKPENATGRCSLHTLTVCRQLTLHSYHILKDALETFTATHGLRRWPDNKNNYQDKIIYGGIAECFDFNTVTLLISKPTKKQLQNYWLEIKINPRYLFHKDEHPFVYIASEQDCEKIFDRVDIMINSLGITWMDKSLFYIKRIDLCFNFRLSSKEDAKEYLELLKKGLYPYNFKRMMEYSQTGKREIPTKNSFTVCSTNIEFSVYNKYLQLSDESWKYTLEEIEEAEGMLRVELRIKRPKVRHCKKKYSLQEEEHFLFLVSQIAEEQITAYLKRCFGTGKFLKIRYAKKVIEGSSFKKKTKKEMVELIDLTKGKHTLQDAKELLGSYEFSKRMKKFEELGISPITLSKRSTHPEFENPIYYIENNCNVPIYF